MSAGIINALTQIVATLFLFRFYLRFCMVGGRAPVANLIARVTNPFTAVIGAVLPKFKRFDAAALILAAAILLFQIGYWYELQSAQWNPLAMGRFVILKMIKILLDLTFFAILIRIINSWLRPGDNSDIALQLIYPCSDWILAPIQRIIPNVGLFDLSPIVALLGIRMVENLFISLLS